MVCQISAAFVLSEMNYPGWHRDDEEHQKGCRRKGGREERNDTINGSGRALDLFRPLQLLARWCVTELT